MNESFATWMRDWLYMLVPALQILLVVTAAILLRWLLLRLARGIAARHGLPPQFLLGARRVVSTVVWLGAGLLILDRLGVSATVLWTAFTGFAAVAAVAFFAAWSVLSNVFCALLIFSTRPFRLLDVIELVDGGDKPGLKGRVVDINLIYTTLQETAADGTPNLLQVPNSLFFQRMTRRWRGDAAAGLSDPGI